MKSLKTLHKNLWDLVSKYIRLKEKGICFTCGAVKDWKETHCGHFLHQAKTSKLAYERKILHCQCVKCNNFLSGNLLEYTVKMVKLHGLKQVEKWKREAKWVYKWKREELEKLIEEYKIKIKALERQTYQT